MFELSQHLNKAIPGLYVVAASVIVFTDKQPSIFFIIKRKTFIYIEMMLHFGNTKSFRPKMQ